jgi:hypothetical protein
LPQEQFRVSRFAIEEQVFAAVGSKKTRGNRSKKKSGNRVRAKEINRLNRLLKITGGS